MIITFSWRGAGLLVLVVFPIVMAIALVCSVNLIGKDFTKIHFREMVIAAIAASGIVCFGLGRWMNRVRVVREVDGRSEVVGSVVEDAHQMWGIAVQHWCWIYFLLAVIVAFAW